jgi:hypothetical protein
MLVAASGWASHLHLSSRAGEWLRKWPLLAEIVVRAVVMAITVAAVIVGLQVVLYDQPLATTWLLAEFPGIVAIAFVSSAIFSAVFELTRLVGGRVLLDVILGRYRRPTREERVLMFLDLAGSTSGAETLGEVRMQELLTRFAVEDRIEKSAASYRHEFGSVPRFRAALQPSRDLRVVALGEAALRGRAAAVEIFAVERSRDASG